MFSDGKLIPEGGFLAELNNCASGVQQQQQQQQQQMLHLLLMLHLQQMQQQHHQQMQQQLQQQQYDQANGTSEFKWVYKFNICVNFYFAFPSW